VIGAEAALFVTGVFSVAGWPCFRLKGQNEGMLRIASETNAPPCKRKKRRQSSSGSECQ
jgi:hypothetical protein